MYNNTLIDERYNLNENDPVLPTAKSTLQKKDLRLSSGILMVRQGNGVKSINQHISGLKQDQFSIKNEKLIQNDFHDLCLRNN